MRQDLTTALNTLDDLTQYLTLIDKTDDLIRYNPTATDSPILITLSASIRSTLKVFSRKRLFEYNSVIVSIYGALESYIEAAIISYVGWLNKLVPSYQALPQAILDNHYELSAQLIRNLPKPKYNKLTTKEEVIKNLYSCISTTSTPYQLNYYAYIEHTANFRHNAVVNILSQIGIDELTIKMLHLLAFNNYLATKYQTTNILNLDENFLFQPLEDLAQRRNDVAHGVTGNTLSHSLLIDLINYVKVYINSLYYVMRQRLFEIACASPILKVTEIQGVFERGNVACFTLPAGQLTINDPVIYTASDTSNELKTALVIDIHVNKISQPTHSWSSPTTICIKLTPGAKLNENSKIFFINQHVYSLITQL